MYSNHYIKANSFQRIKRKLSNEHRPIDYISDENFLKLIKSFDIAQFHEYRDCTITQLLIDTGMRIGETLLIKIDDIDIVRRSIYLASDIAKGRKDRMVIFSAEMGKILRSWL